MRILLGASVLIAAYRETGQADEYSSVAARELLRLAKGIIYKGAHGA